MQNVYARLDKSGNRVLCGGPNNNHRCSFHIGDVVGHPSARYIVLDQAWYPTETLEFKGDRSLDQLSVWRLHRHAEKRVRRGKPARNRRGRYKSFYRGADGVLRTKAAAADDQWIRYEEQGSAPILPALAVCGRCGRRNYLDPQRLAVRSSTI